MSEFKLLMSIVPHDKGEKLTRAAMESGCQGGTVLIGRGLAKSNLEAVLGVGESTKDVILMVVKDEVKNSVKNAIVQAASSEKSNFGELVCIDVNSLFKSGSFKSDVILAPDAGIYTKEDYRVKPDNDTFGKSDNGTLDKNHQNQDDEKNENSENHQNQKDENMAENSNEMITVIVNKGYADDIMAAARKAGAGGGTVLNARGTARENDKRFFGMHIVPEKEMLVIVVPSEKKDEILSAIKAVKCLKEPGMGIVYNSAVEDFYLLGKKK